jgi:hypothetical protein
LISVDELQVARQQALEQAHRPHLQRLGQQRVAGVGEALRWVMSQASSQSSTFLVDQDAHQLGDGDHRMGVVELDDELVGKRPVAVAELVADDVLAASRHEEVLLLRRSSLPCGVVSLG